MSSGEHEGPGYDASDVEVINFIVSLDRDLTTAKEPSDPKFLRALDRYYIGLEVVVECDIDRMTEEERLTLQRSIIDDFKSHMRGVREIAGRSALACALIMTIGWLDAPWLFIWMLGVVGCLIGVCIGRSIDP